MAWERILWEKHEGIATITLNQPRASNVMGNAMAQEMIEALADAERDDGVKVVILTGAGRAFSQGAAPARARPPEPEVPLGRDAQTAPMNIYGVFARRLYECRKPVLAAINGMCAGVALSLALGCDLRIASENARFCFIYVRRGLLASSGGTFLMPRVVGVAKALELMWTGDTIDAREALRIGLVGRVVPHDQLLPATREFALRLVRGPSLSIELTRSLARRALEVNDLMADISAEAWAQGICRASEDFHEGVNSFLAKREPVFQGR